MRLNAWVLGSLLLASPAALGANLIALSVSPTSVVGGVSGATGTVTLDVAAPSGGVVVNLSSKNAAASVPANVTVAQGAATATFTVTTTTVAANVTPTLTATFNAVNKTATLTVTPLLSALVLVQSSVVGSMSATGTLALNAPAPVGGAVVTLTSSVPARATVPASITIPAGATLYTFAIPTLPTTTTGTTTITATNADFSRTAVLTTSAVPIPDSVALAPSTAFGSSTSTASIALNGGAAIGGTVVTLTSSNTAAATVPANVTVPAGAAATTFTVTTLTVTTNTNVTITAASGGTSKTATLTVAPSIQAFSTALDRPSVPRGQVPTATVTLNGPAPSGGATVTLTSSSTPNATVPASVVVAAGVTSATFPVTTLTTGTLSSVTVSALYGGVTKSAVLTLTATPIVLSVAFSPSVVAGGQPSTGTVTVSGPAPTGGAVVALSSSNSSVVSLPASVTVPEGASTATFAAATALVGNNVATAISAALGASSTSAPLTVTGPLPTVLTLAPATVVGGNNVTGTVTISVAAPAGGVPVFLLSSNVAVATGPTSVTVPAGATSATFTVTTLGVAAAAPVTISAAKQQTAVTASLTVNPASLASVVLSPTTLVAGAPSTGTVTLNGKAKTGGISVALTSSDTTKATVPASVVVAAGAVSATFTVTTLGVVATASSTISGTYNGTTKSATLTVQPSTLSNVTLSASPVVGGNNVTGTITLNGKAASTGFAVSLSSSVTTCATAPATVTVATNATTATFTVTTLGVAANASSTITATLAGVSKTAVISTMPAALTSLTLSPTAVGGGASSTGTLTLNGNAPPAGAVVSTTISDGAATVPATVTIAANTKTKTLTVTTTAVATAHTATISGTYSGSTKTAILTINPPVLSNVSLSPTTVGGGVTATGTVTISSIALAGGFAVNLTSNNVAATVPASVTVAQGATTATFAVTTVPVPTVTVATITATAGTVTKTANLTINPPALSGVFLSPTALGGGWPATGTVTISSIPMAGGFTVNLTSNNIAAAVPASVTVAQGATTATFAVTTVPVPTVTVATITATAGTVTKTANLTINPPALSSISLSPNAVGGGTSTTATVTISSIALAGGFTVNLTSNNLAATVPASVTVAQSARTATFTVTTAPVGTSITATITATAGTVTKTAALTVNPPAISSLSLSPTAVTCGSGSTGTVGLTGPAAAGGVVVLLSSTDVAAVVPATVTVAANTTSATFSVSTTTVATAHTATIRATYFGVTQTAPLTVNPPALASVSVSPATVGGGTSLIGTVALAGIATTSGFAVSLTSDNAAATVPTSVMVVGGASSATFIVSTNFVGGSTTAQITASAAGATKTAALTINPVPLAPASLVLNPASLTGGASSTGAVTLTAPAQSGGFVVNLSSDNAAATVPASVTVPGGTTTATFTVATGAIGTVTTATVTATASAVTKAATLTINPPPGAVVGTVRDASTGIAVPRAVVTVTGSATTATTDGSGSFSLPVVPGNRTLTITAQNLQPVATASLPVMTGQTTDAGIISLGAVQGFSFEVRPAIASGSETATAMVSLVAVAPAGGAVVTITSDRSSVVVPASVTVPGGTRVLTFPVTYARVASSTWVTISATNAGITNQAHVMLTPGPTVVSISQPAKWPYVGRVDSIFGPADLESAVALSEPAPGGGLQVSLTSSNTPMISVPATILVPAGALLVTFPVHAAAVATTTISTITASLPSGSASALLTDTSAVGLSSISVPPYGRTGKSIQIQVVLNVENANGTYVVNLTSSNPTAVPVPATVEPTGYPPLQAVTSVTLGAASASPVVITASLAGISRSTTITVSSTSTAVGASFDGGTLSFGITDPQPIYAYVYLYSSNPSVVRLPASTTIPAGNTSTSVNATVTRGPSTASVVLSGSCGREVMTPLVDVTPSAAPISLSVSAHMGSGTGTVYLNAMAPMGGTTVLLGTSAPSVLSIPASVLVPAGTNSASFTFSTFPVASATFASVTATSAGVTVTGSLTVQAPIVWTLALSPTNVQGGSISTGTVTLNGPAPTAGHLLSLSSSNPVLVIPPATATVPGGASSVSFPIATAGTASNTTVTVTASDGTRSASANLTVSGALIASVTLNPTSVQGGTPSTGTVTLSGVAPAGGALVTLSSGNTPAATVPANMTIPAGALSATFPVTTYPVVGTTNLHITAYFAGFSQYGVFTVTALAPTLTWATVSPAVINGGLPATGRVALTTTAPAGGIVVSLSSSNAPVATTPPNVTVPAGTTYVDFTVTTTGVASSVGVTISATYAGVTQTASFTVDPAILQSVTLSPFSLLGGTPSKGTVSLIGSAPPAGLILTLASSDTNVATVPPGMTVPAGASSATFPVSTNASLTTGSATISATGGYRNETRSAVLTVTPAPVVLASFSLSVADIVGGAHPLAVGTVTLNALAPAGGASVRLSSSDTTSAYQQATVDIPAGSTSGTFTISTWGVASTVTVTISADYNGVTKTALLTVNPAALASLVLTPTSVGGGVNGSATVGLNGYAPPAGAVVALSSSLPGTAAVPASVTIPARAQGATFSVATTPVSVSTPVVITTTYAAASVTATLTVEPFGPASVSIPQTLKAGNSFGGHVVLNGPAPAGGVNVQVTSSGAVDFFIPTGYSWYASSRTVSIQAGQIDGFFEMVAPWSSGGGTGTVSASLNGVTKSATITVTPGTVTFSIDPSTVLPGGSASGYIRFDGYSPRYDEPFPVALSSSNPGSALTETTSWACVISPCGTSGFITVGTPWTFLIGVAPTSGTGATTISATFLEFTASATLNVVSKTLSGVAPGWVLAGDTTPVIYGSSIEAGSTVTFTGPVYSLTNFQNPLCTVGGTCPSSNLAATVDVGGKYAAFAIPAGASPGIYHLTVRSAAGLESTNNLWVGVDNAQKTYPPVARDQHNWAKRIWPGQTVTGTLTGGVPLNDLADYNYYFFVATAGSRVSVAMQRVDTSIPFGNPASLDPQVEIVSPDHFIYENLQGFDDVPSVDYNASITNAVLPHTGVYFIAVETTRGSGDYRLTFNVDFMAPVPQTSRAVAFSGNHNTLTVNTTLSANALMLDPRGWPLSGADVNHTVISSPDNLGTVQFVGGSTTTTSVDGYAFVYAKLTSPGKVGFSPVLVDSTLAQGVVLQEETAAAVTSRQDEESPKVAVQRYRPAGRLPISIVGISGHELSLSGGRLERFPAPELAGRKSIAGEELKFPRRATLRTKAQSASTSNGAAGSAPHAARSPARPLTIRPQVITGCFPTVFDEAAVSAPQVNPPFTVVLTDETPSTGQSTANGVVDEIDGIHGHRTGKEIRLRIAIKDAYGQTPNYPVLVSLAPGGAAPGTIILDPAGARIECESASLFWHETPGANEEIGYKLGTYSHFLGVEVTTPPHKPVWGMGEILDLAINTLDASGLSLQNEYVYPVRVEPGKPDHFSCVDASGVPCPNLLAYWSDFLKFRSGTKLNGNPRFESLGTQLFNSYFLNDRYDNVTYGYTSTSASQPQPNIFVEFKDQTLSIFGESSDTTDFAGYSTWVHWNDDPSMPSGRYTTTLSVNYPNDPDWAGGTVTKNLDLQFDRGTYHALVPFASYEARLGVDDGGTPFSVAPGATTSAMPKTSAGDVRRLVLLGMAGSQVIGSWPLQVEPFEDPHTIWKQNPSGPGWVVDRLESPEDPRLETSDAPRFRLSLRDEEGKVVTEGAFRVHRCPRFDHEGPPQQSLPSGQAGRPCDTLAVPPLDSLDGVIDPVTLNASGGSNNRGYLGIELLKAPARLGYYFLQVDPSSGDTPRYRIRLVNKQGDQPEAEYWGGEAFFVVENKIDPNAMCCTCQDGETIESPCTASPVFADTGTYQSEATDLVLPTAGLPLQVSRKYFSSKRQSDLNGIGWSSSLQAHLAYVATSAGQALDIQMPTGVVFRFTFSNASGPFTPPQGRKDTLVRNVDKTFDLTPERSRIVYHFDDKGRLVSMKDEYGNTVTIGYDASGKPTQVADASGSGRFITVSYRGDGKIDRLQDSAGRSVQYAYAADGTLTSVTNPAGLATRYSYTQGSFGPLLTQIADHWNRVLTVMTYDVADRAKTYTENFETYSYTYIDTTHTRKTDSLGNSTTVAFGGAGLIVDSTPPATSGSGTTHKDYDREGNVTGIIDEVGVRTDFTYDPAGRVTSVTRDVLGSPVRFDYTYDPAFPDKVTSVTPKNPISGVFEPNWQGWRYDYLASGTLNHVKRLQSDGATTSTISTFQYDAQGRVTQQTSSTGAVTNYAYTGGNLTTVTQPTNADSGIRPITQYSNYDGVGRPRTITDPAAKDTTYTYDALGRVLKVTLPKPTPGFPSSFTTTYTYDNYDSASGLVFTNITDPNGRLTKLGYDQHGRLLKSIDALNNVTTYAYMNDVLTSITDANGNVTSYHYDPLKRLDKTTFPDGSIESYAYGGDGLLASKTDRRGQTIAYTYDGFKRLKKKDYGSNGTITYTYQGQKLTQVVDTTLTPSETHTFGYDTSYRVAQNVQGPRGTLSYTYTPDDRVDTMTIAGTPNVTTAHTYYSDGSLNTISWSPQAGLFKYAYTPRGQYQTVTFPNGQTRTYVYDDQGRLTQIANALGATNLATYAYGYDVDWATGLNTMLGQRVSVTGNVPSQGFTNAQTKYSYDPLYQLVKAQYPAAPPFNGEVDQWTYDAIGNRLTNQVNAAIQSYTYFKNGANPLDGQELQNDGANAYAYDLNGNQTARSGPGGNYVFSSDFDNRLRSITGATGAAYTYDYQGRRISKTIGGVTTTYLYDGLNLVREATAGTNTDYTFGPSIDEPLALYRAGTLSYIDVDGLGTDVGENSPAGTLTHHSLFDVWGVTKTETGTRFSAFGYTGREFGEAGLFFYRARYYQPGVGRFAVEDPMGFLSGPSRFGYVHANPTRAGDPLGLFDWVRDLLEPVSNFSAGFGDTISLGITYRIRALTGANDVVDPCDFWYGAGDKAGLAHSLALGGVSAARGALAMGGRSGSLLARLARGGGRFFSDPRTAGTVSRQYWGARGGAGVMSLHHWLLPQRAGALNAGWNLLEVPGAFNSWMGYSSVGRGVEWGLRAAIPGSLVGAAIEGALWGISRDEWQQRCGCGR